MIAHHHRKRRPTREATVVQSDRQFMGLGSKHSIGDDLIRASRIYKSENSGAWEAFSFALDELA
jgi:hypothetical protein